MAASAPAQILDGKYRLLRQLSDGGTVELYLGATRGTPRRAVLVKRVAPNLAKNKPTVAGFLEEARTTARLQHGSILQVLDIGEDGGTYVAVFEHVFGANLDEVLEAEKRRRGQLPIGVALRLVAGALSALEHAHGATADDGSPLHLVHRDVSAKNVLLGYDGTVKLGGFGAAKHDQRSEQTSFGVIRGQLAYVSPEQLRAQELDARADVWACGVLLYQLLTGALPFDRPGEFHILKAIREEPHKLASELRPELPAALDEVLDLALAKDREKRFGSAAELRQALEDTGLVSGRAELAEYAAELFGERLGAHRADAVAGRASVQAVVQVVGGTEVSPLEDEDSTTGEAPRSTDRAELPGPPAQLARELDRPRVSQERSARPPSAAAKARSGDSPRVSHEKPLRPPAAPPPPEVTRDPPAPTRFAALPSEPEVVAERPVMPTAPPRQVARAEPKREAVDAPKPSRKIRAQKRRFRLVTERGLTPAIYPAAVLAAVALGFVTVHARRIPEQVLEPLPTHAPPLAILDEPPPRALPKPAEPVRPVAPPPVQAQPEMQLTGETPLKERGKPGALRVEGPRGTRVIVDRHSQGSAPVTVALAPGTHQVRYLLPNGGIKDESLKIDAGRTVHRKLQAKDIPPQPRSSSWP